MYFSYVWFFFLQTVQKRGAAVIAARKLSSAMSAAKAACDHMRDWFHGTSEVNNAVLAIIEKDMYTLTMFNSWQNVYL